MLHLTSIFLAFVHTKESAADMKTVSHWVEYIFVFIFILQWIKNLCENEADYQNVFLSLHMNIYFFLAWQMFT